MTVTLLLFCYKINCSQSNLCMNNCNLDKKRVNTLLETDTDSLLSTLVYKDYWFGRVSEFKKHSEKIPC